MVKRIVWMLVLSGLGAWGLIGLWGGWLQALRPQPMETVLLGGAAAAQNITEVGHMGGLANAVFISGTVAYAGLGAELALLDITNPYTPTRIGYASLPALATDVVVDGNVAYVAAAESGLHLFDIQNPTSPTYLSTFTTTGQVQAVIVRGSYAYLAESLFSSPYGRITALDVSNPLLPTLLGRYNLNAPAYHLALGGNLLYVAADYGGLRLLNISNPSQITQVSVLATPGWARGIAIQGVYAYVIQTNCASECTGYLSIINVSNPANPSANSHTLLPGSGADLTVLGDYAYLADRNGGLRIMQISNPNAPFLTSFVDTPGTAWAIATQNSLAYVADEMGGLQIYNVFDPFSIVQLGLYEVTNHTLHVAVNGSVAYVADWSGVQVMDISNPALPTLGTLVPLPDTAEYIALNGAYAYVAAGDVGGIRILDISNPAQPTVVGFYNTPGTAHRLVIRDNRAYVADGDKGLRILSLANPTNPTLIGFYDTPGEAWDVSLQGNYAYVADQAQGVRVIEVSNPSLPVEVGFYLPVGQSVSVVAEQDTAYVATLNGFVAVLDISTPATPILLTTVNTGGWAYQLGLREHTLFAAASTQGLRVFDVTDPTTPQEMAYLDTGGNARGVTLAGDQVWVADQSGGVTIAQESYTISGRVADHAGVPQSGVIIQASNGLSTTTTVSGTYGLTGFVGSTVTLTPTLPNFRFSPASQVITVGPSVEGLDFVVVPAPVMVTLNENAAATLIYTDTQGLPTQFTFPVGAVTTTTTVAITPTLLTLNSLTLATIGHNFDLAVYQNNVWLPNFTFAAPVEVKMRYSNLDLGSGSNEAELYLGRWDGGAWPDAAATCVPPSTYNHNVLTNQITIGICRPGSFAFLLPQQLIYLPFIPKQ